MDGNSMILKAVLVGLLAMGGSLWGEEVYFSHDSYEDFAAGKVGNAGQNLFVSHDGQIRFIQLFDYNNDGHPEIFVVNDHNFYDTSDAFIYYNQPGHGFSSLLPPTQTREDVAGFLQLRWMLDSLKNIERLPTLGGGKPIAADFNQDGYLDIVFTNWVHGWYQADYPVLIYWGGANGYSRERVSTVPTSGGDAVAAADLNNNGRLDLVVANNGREDVIRGASAMTAAERREAGIAEPESRSYVYWNTVYGFNEDSRTELPTEYAIDVKAADLTGNGYQDLVFLQAGREGSIRIFESGPKGVDPEKYTDLPALDPTWSLGTSRAMLLADLNDDGKIDIFVPSNGDVSRIFWNSKDGFGEDNVTDIEAVNASAAAAADLNGDGHTDLVVANLRGNVSYVYYGTGNDFSPSKRHELPTLQSTDVTIADLNKDGVPDLIFANRRDSARGTVDAPAYIYWGSPDGHYSPAMRDELVGYGAEGVITGDFNRNGREDILLMNRWSGTSGRIDSYIYWGNDYANYSPSTMTRLPGVPEGLGVVATDLTGNGHADLIYVANRPGKHLYVFYGENGNFDYANPSVMELPFARGGMVMVADLNRDGFLDLVVTSTSSEEIAVFHGDENGFGDAIAIKTGVATNSAALGDLNGDGRLDLVLGNRKGGFRVLWGQDDGLFNINNSIELETGLITGPISLADFNGDGWLDIFAVQRGVLKPSGRDEYSQQSAIYWNRNGLFSTGNRTELSSHWASQGSVADANSDGYPDILIANYHGEINRDMPTYIYPGNRRGRYSESGRIELPSHSSAGNLVLDLDGDGYMDIIVYNHSAGDVYHGLMTRGANHAVGSFIYWGDKEGWSIERRSIIPSFGPHARQFPDPGNIMDRSSHEVYVSRPVDLYDARKGEFYLIVDAEANSRQSIRAFMREGGDEGVEGKDWWELEPVELEGSPFAFEGRFGAESFQYKLQLDSGHSGAGPVVHSVRMLSK